jgi:hypothetical protein
MTPEIKVVELVSGNLLIGYIDFLEQEPSIYLRNCYSINKKTSGYILVNYPLYADTHDVIFDSTSVFTIYDPDKTLLKRYIAMVGVIHSDMSSEEEDATAILKTLYDEEEYE